jgi:hypothetical protein
MRNPGTSGAALTSRDLRKEWEWCHGMSVTAGTAGAAADVPPSLRHFRPYITALYLEWTLIRQGILLHGCMQRAFSILMHARLMQPLEHSACLPASAGFCLRILHACKSLLASPAWLNTGSCHVGEGLSPWRCLG